MDNTYILIGGKPEISQHLNELFSLLETKQNGHINLLSCQFARDTERREPKFLEFCQFFYEHSSIENCNMRLAKTESFYDDLQWADVIWFDAGIPSQLFTEMKQFPDWTKHLNGKFIVGNSSGSYLLSQYFFSSHEDVPQSGFGLVPCKVIAHFNSPEYFDPTKWAEREQILLGFGDANTPTFALTEGSFVVYRENKFNSFLND